MQQGARQAIRERIALSGRARRSVCLELEDRTVYLTSREAWKLVKSGRADIVKKFPFTIRARNWNDYCSSLARWGARSDEVYVMNGELIGKAVGGGFKK
jgi:hypothetical protein